MGIEKEVKFAVSDQMELMEKIRPVARYLGATYIRDTIYGAPKSQKIRLRTIDDGARRSIEAVFKYKTDREQDFKTEVEETIYEGHDLNLAKQAINAHGEFRPENSYEKIRLNYETDDTKITLDIYPFGSWLEIEGEPEAIWRTADLLGFKKPEGIKENADELYLQWIKKNNMPELWDVRFGLADVRDH